MLLRKISVIIASLEVNWAKFTIFFLIYKSMRQQLTILKEELIIFNSSLRIQNTFETLMKKTKSIISIIN